jgi:pimeloyl-ACP methyl ester carboxylesterase
MTMFKLVFRSVLLLGAFLVVARGGESPEPPKPATRSVRTIEGWTVRVDDRLLQTPSEAIGKRSLQLLEAKLADIKSVVAADRLARLQAVPIVLDLTHGKLRTMQYHPSASWLEGHGYARDLARCVHIPEAAGFINARANNEQQWCVLHELAHAYHDQVLDFDEPRIRKAYEIFKESGHGDSVLRIGGRRAKHYALTDQKEFFAEMSEAYFGVNDFYPFNRGELKTAEPEIYALLEKVWSPPFKGLGAEDAVVSTQFGARRHDFVVAGSKGFVLLPTKPAEDGTRPWVWYAPTLMGQHPDPSHEWLFTRLLAAGFAVAGVDVGESYGSPKGREAYTKFHQFVVDKYALSPQACLLPQSRGGLMLYNWAAEHPQSVRCIGGIYTVCDQSSWPGLAKSCTAYGMSEDELREALAQHNPIERLEPLAKAKVPILHLHGNADTLVPLERNSAELARRYRGLGGEMELVVIDGKGHQVCPEFFESKRLLEFFLKQGILATRPGADSGK